MSAQDPFYLVKEEIQDSVDKVRARYQEYEQLSAGTAERERLHKDLLGGCESIEWQVDELDRAISVAERDPARFNVDAAEIEKRRRWTSNTRSQMELIKRSLLAAADRASSAQKEDHRRELLRMPDSNGGMAKGAPRPSRDIIQENDEFIGGEDDHQALLMRQQDEHLDYMSESLAKIGGLGIAISDELGSQDKLISELHADVDTTNNRLELVQRKMAAIIKKAGVKGQLCMIVALLVLLIILIVLVFYT